ncbi:MAG TPA: FG-GAP-like repeat-containing protein, partial [Candidatus Glassbacteria bacterium]|nr:FG-GAP-like repeat-containing protein [Candidatus Glassbacteria bacterium]
EVVVATAGGMVYAWNVDRTGELVAAHGWPVSLSSRITATPVLADLDGDGTRDVIVVARTGQSNSRIHALDENGSSLPGFPITLDEGIEAGATVQTDGAGLRAEMIFVATLAGNLYAYGPDGSRRWSQAAGSPFESTPAVGRLGLPGDGESVRVFAFGADGRIYCFAAADGSPVSGWPVSTGGACLAGGAIGDVDGDGLNELVAPVDFPDSSAPGRHQLYVLEYNCASLTGYPIPLGSAQTFASRRYLGSPAIADLDGDGRQDIVLTSLGRLALAFAGDGNRRPFARFILGSNSLAAPVPADIDGDGSLDLVCADGEGYIYAYGTASHNLSAAWPGLAGGAARTGMSLAVQDNPGLTQPGEVLPERFCYIYPNPLKSGLAHLSYRLGSPDVQRVTVEVFTTSGERVANFEGTTESADGLANEISWEVDSYASGVYIVMVKAYSAGAGTAKALRKLAVIR